MVAGCIPSRWRTPTATSPGGQFGLQGSPLLGKPADAFLHPTADFLQHGRQVERRQVDTQRFQHADDDAATVGAGRRLVGPAGLAACDHW